VKKTLLTSAVLALAGVGLMAGGAIGAPFTNGDFETGDLTGWELMPFTGTDEALVVNSPNVMSGYYAQLNDSDSDGFAGIYQSFDIDPSATIVDVSFDYYFTGTDTSNWYSDVFESTFAFKSGNGWFGLLDWEFEFNVITTSEDVMETVVSFSASYDVSLLDDSPNANIQFGLLESDGWCSDSTNTWLGVDNVMVSSNAAPVPEPATMLLFGTGLVGLAGARRRKMKKNS
jgi:hypothetical protein